MSDQIQIHLGSRPWQPAGGTSLMEVYDFQDHPVSGVLEQAGTTYLFSWIVGDLDRASIWIYTPLSSADLRKLEETAGESFWSTFGELLNRPPFTAVVASTGRIRMEVIVETEQDAPTAEAAAMAAIGHVLDETSSELRHLAGV